VCAPFVSDSDAFGTKKPEDLDDDHEDYDHDITVNLRFAGQYYDSETGLYYNWHRYYDPKTGRYISSDPIGLAGGLNTYTYALGNPLYWVDPSGLDVLNPNNYPISDKVLKALWEFNRYIGCDKDIEITGGNRPNDDEGSPHRDGIAADIKVPGQLHLLTANQAGRSGLFGGVGWYQEGYYDPNIKGSGPHVHVDLGAPNRKWGFDVNRYRYRGKFPLLSPTLNEGKEKKDCRCSRGSP